MNLFSIKNRLLFLFLFFSHLCMANPTEKMLIQIKGKYLPIEEATATRGGKIIQQNNTAFIELKNVYYPVNNKNIQALFDRKQLLLIFKAAPPLAEIYFDNYYMGLTNKQGDARFSQLYPETGDHTLKMIKNKTSKLYKFPFKKDTLVTCYGKNFVCEAQK
jgi:hypothetical protein